jgi:hypothetical protein
MRIKSDTVFPGVTPQGKGESGARALFALGSACLHVAVEGAFDFSRLCSTARGRGEALATPFKELANSKPAVKFRDPKCGIGESLEKKGTRHMGFSNEESDWRDADFFYGKISTLTRRPIISLSESRVDAPPQGEDNGTIGGRESHGAREALGHSRAAACSGERGTPPSGLGERYVWEESTLGAPRTRERGS